MTPTPVYQRPTGYDIFAPGGLQGACESDPSPVFTSHITDLSLIDSLTPAGTVQRGDLKPHGYLHNSGSKVPVYAPVDSYLISHGYYLQSGDAIYKLDFQVSCEVAYYFDHIQTVAEKIAGVVFQTPREDSRGIPPSTLIPFLAGELIGYTGGSPLTRTWNDLPTDVTFNYSPNVDKYRFAVCQYEYFPESIKVEYLALLTGQDCGP